MKITVKKLLSTLLAVVMVLGLFAALPAPASAASIRLVNSAASLKTELGRFESGDTIRLMANIDYYEGIEINGKSLTIDLYTFYLNVYNSAGAGLNVSNGGEVILAGESAVSKFNVTGREYGVYVGDGKATVSNINTSFHTGRAVFAAGTGNLTVNGNVTGIMHGVRAMDSATVTVNGSISGGTRGVAASDAANVTVNGDVSATESGSAGISADGTSNVTVNGDVFGAYRGISADGSATVTVNGDVTANSAYSRGVLSSSGVNAKVYITGILSAYGYDGKHMELNGTIFIFGIDVPTNASVTLPAPYNGYIWNEYKGGNTSVFLRGGAIVEAPTITTQPVSQSAVAGGTSNFSVVAADAGTLTYQWEFSTDNGGTWSAFANDIAPTPTGQGSQGTKTAELKLSNIHETSNGYQYRCVVTNSAGSVTSNAATLTLTEKTVTIGAQSGTLKPGEAGTVSFPVTTVGVDNGKVGTVSWFSNAAGTTTGIAPTGISAAMTVVDSNASRVSIQATNATVAGTYYFKVTIDGVVSALAMLKIEAAATAGAGSMANFKKVKTYTRGQFADVNEAAWYGLDVQGVVAIAYDYDLMQGTTSGFSPINNYRIAEALAVAARVHSIYTTGSQSFVQVGTWYQVYLDYCIEKGIIEANDFKDRYLSNITRAEMAYIFSRTLPASELKQQNVVNKLPDVSSTTPYCEAILMMYEAGLLEGTGADHRYNPDNPIRRNEAAAIIARLILPTTRFIGKTYG